MNTERKPGNPTPPARAIDLQALIDSGMGEILPELIATFLETAPHTVEEAGAAVRDARAADIAHAAHDLSGSCSHFGATRLRALCRELETLGRTGSLRQASEIFAALQAEFGQVRAELLAWLGQRP